MPTNEEIVFLSAKRTPFGTFLGSLNNLSATDLGVIAARSALEAASVKPEWIDHVVFGNVMQTSADAIYLARHVGLRCHVPLNTPAVTVNRLCGSGFEAIVQGASLLRLGEASCVLAGGAESMSQAPFVLRGARKGLRLGKGELEDALWSGLTDSFVNLPMAMTAENLAEQYHVSQDDVDAYAVQSQKRHEKAQQDGFFADELVSVSEGKVKLDHDEHARHNTSLEELKKLPKVFKKDGVIHAGAASGIADGAAALVMSTRSFAERNHLPILGRLVQSGVVGCDPKIMGIGPVAAMEQALKRAGLTLRDMDMIEVNEAFSPQVLAVKKALDLPNDRLNLDGGAIAMGHPLAASGARIVAHLLHALKNRGQKRAIGSACIGGGQGIAVIVEAL